MSGWCPAGKCECENLHITGSSLEQSFICAASRPKLLVLSKFEVCPWPSKQSPQQQHSPDWYAGAREQAAMDADAALGFVVQAGLGPEIRVAMECTLAVAEIKEGK